MRHLLMLIPLLVTGGCAADFVAYKNRAISDHDFDHQSIITMTGDRRMAVVVDQYQDPEGTYVVCPESLPDAAAAIGATSSANVAAGKTTIGTSDSVREDLLLTFQRTDAAEILRQLSFTSCLAWAQKAITNEQYKSYLDQIMSAGTSFIENRGKQPPPALAKPDATTIALFGDTSVPTNAVDTKPSLPTAAPTPTSSPTPSSSAS